MSSERLSLDLIEFPSAPSGLLRRVLVAIACWRRDALQRDALATFDARMLRDIGLTEADVWRETCAHRWLGF